MTDPNDVAPRGIVIAVDTGGQPLDADIRAALEGLGTVVEQPIVACDGCGFFDCICELRKLHKPDCRLLKAASSYISFPCVDHGLDVCTVCDPCTCGAAP